MNIMVLESLTNPFNAEKRPSSLIFLGFLYSSLAAFLSLWIFRQYSSLIVVFLTTMAAVPLIYNIIKMEEEKDLTDLNEHFLFKEHTKALKAFMFLFLGITLALSFWYVVLPSGTISILFESQSSTINAINSPNMVSAKASSSLNVFFHIFSNNLKVLVFCILFSFLYGVGAIFILTWNASVVSTAIGNYIRSGIASIAAMGGALKIASYFKVISLGLFKYSIHGIPEIFAYFMAGLAGGIISIAVIRHDFGTRKFEHIVLDSADLILVSLLILFIAALLEVYVTPVIF